MTASLSGTVNQHVFHAKLLLEVIDELGEQSAFRKIKVQALESSAISALYRAFQSFLIEVADSCQIKSTMTSLGQFEQLLASEGRSHAVVNSLRVLMDKPSWLSSLSKAFDELLTDMPTPDAIASANLITLSDISEHIDTAQMIQQFEDFVSVQREFLQEW